MSVETATAAPNVVRLQAQNIDLQQRLNAAEAQMQELRQQLSSHTVHVHHPGAKGPKVPQTLDDLLPGKGPRDVVSCEEYDKLETELEEVYEREEQLKRTITELRTEIGTLCDASERNEALIAKLRAELEAERKKTAEAVAARQKQDALVAELNDALERLQRKSNSPQRGKGAAVSGGAVDDDEDECLAAFVAEESGAGAKTRGADGTGEEMLVATESFIAEEIETRVAERLRELETKHQEDLFLATAEQQERIDHQKQTIQAQQDELKKLKELMADTLRIESERNAAIKAMEQAVAERNIATKSKEVVMEELKVMQKTIIKNKTEITHLREQVAVLNAGNSTTTTSAAASRTATGESEGASPPWIDAILKEKDAHIKFLSDQVAELRVTANLHDSAAGKGVIEAVAKQRKEFDEKRAELEADLERANLELALCRSERDKALAAGRKAFLERNSALDEAKRLEHMQRIQTEKKETNVVMVREVFAKVSTNYDKVIEKLEQATTPDEMQGALYDVLFDYERRIWHLNNDVLSLRTIVDIAKEDERAVSSMASREHQQEISLLRAALIEAREALSRPNSSAAGSAGSMSNIAVIANRNGELHAVHHHADPHQRVVVDGVPIAPLGGPAAPPPNVTGGASPNPPQATTVRR